MSDDFLKQMIILALTFQFIKHTNGLNDVSRVGEHLDDVILHGTHHTKPRLMTCMERKTMYNIRTNSRQVVRAILQNLVQLHVLECSLVSM